MCVRAVYVWCVRGAGKTVERGRIWTSTTESLNLVAVFLRFFFLILAPLLYSLSKRLTLILNAIRPHRQDRMRA